MSTRNLLQKYAVKEDTFTIELWGLNPETKKPEVDTLTVRQVKGTQELTELKRNSNKFYAMLTSKQVPPPKPLRAFLPMDEATAEKVFTVSALMLDPPVTQVEALEMARDAGALLTRIYSEILERNILAAGMMPQEVIDATKKLAKQPPAKPVSPVEKPASERLLNAEAEDRGDE